MAELLRAGNRGDDELRPFSVDRGIQPQAYSSLLIRTGDTEVLCAVSLEEQVPPFLEGSGRGWITAEYAILPGATSTRHRRETGTRSGRSLEIQRLIGRSLRMMTDLAVLDGYTLRVDCDVINADGGTRTASVTGAALAVKAALARMAGEGRVAGEPAVLPLAAVSVGIVAGRVLLDLDYREDSGADGDANFVMAGGDWIEIQATAEKRPITDGQFEQMKAYARRGIDALFALWSVTP